MGEIWDSEPGRFPFRLLTECMFRGVEPKTRVVFKNVLTPIAVRHHMKNRTGCLVSERAGHTPPTTRPPILRQLRISRTDPETPRATTW